MHTPGWEWFLLLVLLVWVGALHLLARVGGWASLARVYRLEDSFAGDRWRFQSGQMRWATNYGSILTVGANRRGLYLAVFLPFRFGHPPLFIPFADISAGTMRGRAFAHYELGFRRVPGIPFRVSERLGRRIATAAGPSWPGHIQAETLPKKPSQADGRAST